MAPISITYVSRTAKTRRVAEQLHAVLGDFSGGPVVLKDVPSDVFLRHELNILGTPTYGMGEMDFRWVKFLQGLDSRFIKGRRFALFALGDQMFHGATFAGSLSHLARGIVEGGGDLVGRWSCEEYTFQDSSALGADGHFPGLVLDEISQAHLTEKRIRRWIEVVKRTPSCHHIFGGSTG